jgi:hypothetical protein
MGPVEPSGAVQPGWPETGWQSLRLVGNIVNLTTPAGVLVALIGRTRLRRGPRGLILGEGYKLKFPVAGAFTIGNVITTSSTWEEKLKELPSLLQHEEGHTWQYLYCIGMPFYLAYGICMGWSVLRTGDRAARNFFERQAGLAIGGYADLPTRPISAGIAAIFTKRTS